MGTVYVASSKALQGWAADVGLGKNVYKVGWTDDLPPEQAVAGCAGQTDWKILKTAEAEGPEAGGRRGDGSFVRWWPAGGLRPNVEHRTFNVERRTGSTLDV